MKRYYFITLGLMLLCAGTSYSQMSFEMLPFPDSLKTWAIAINSEDDIFALTTTGENDGILRSLDGGYSWQFVYHTSLSPRDIKIRTNGEIYALAFSQDSSLLKSSDNGETWIKKFLPYEVYQQKIFLYGTDSIFISQSKSNGVRLLRSINDGMDWDTIFETSLHAGEMLTDLAIDSNGDMYISLFGFWETSGGVYKSADNGLTWQFLGLLPSQITDLEFNSSGDLYISSRGPGICVIDHGSDVIRLVRSAFASGLVINSGDDIYAGSIVQNGIFHSSDGQSFELITPVMPGDCPISALYLDSEEFIYAIMEDTPYIAKSTVSTVTSSKAKLYYEQAGIYIDTEGNALKAFLKHTSNEKCSYRIIDCCGKTTASGEGFIDSSTLEIQLPVLGNGIYFLQLVTGSSQISGKFLIR